MKNFAKVREIRTLYSNYYSNNYLPGSWLPIRPSENDIIHSIARANGKDLSHLTDIQKNMPAYASADTKNKIVGQIGKFAVCSAFGFSPEYMFGKKRAGFDFFESGCKIVVKSTGYMRGEVMLLDEKAVLGEGAPDIYVYVVVDIDIEDVYSIMAHVAGWTTRAAIKEASLYAEDMKGSPMFMPLDRLKEPRSLEGYLSLMGMVRAKCGGGSQ